MLQVFQLDSLHTDRATHAEPYHEFLRTRDMSVGLYHLEPGAHDPQGAHAEDVLFHVIRGEAELVAGDTRLVVSAGSIVHIPAGVPPRFEQVNAALDVLVVFAPAESAPTVPVHHTA
jgi:quercetin dioxygenase-like cupin family protein